MKVNYGIHWFRRDLRVAGNLNLNFNCKKSEQKVLGLFCFDSSFLSRTDFSHNRFAFFLETLKVLKAELQAQGGDLLVVDEAPEAAFAKLFEWLKKRKYDLPSLVSFGCDYEPFARKRDERIKTLLARYGVGVHAKRDHLVIEPHEVLKSDNSFYQVYSPYAKNWFKKLATKDVQLRISEQRIIDKYRKTLKTGRFEKCYSIKWNMFKEFPFVDQLEQFTEKNRKHVTIKIPPAGFAAAYERVTQFSEAVQDYNLQRDYPWQDGTSQLSIYQKNGSFVSSQILYSLNLQNKGFNDQDNSTQFVKEIAWREFYYSIMFHRPDCEKNAFLKKYENLNWVNNKSHFQKWCEGKTGFPIVDAGMRQLNTTGWMHNRVRMIVASFLVKDLLIDWRWGESYFMKMLLDGDLAPNNGGWQWAASTGCDPQPYFRIFNPWLQAARFDPEAKYIKTYIPELRNLTAKQIHDKAGLKLSKIYPAPIVIHDIQKQKALLLFENVKRGST